MMKWIGATLVFSGCAGFGFSMAFSYRRKEGMLEQLVSALTTMECELKYRLTPLPDLCSHASETSYGLIRKVLHQFSLELNRRVSPDAASCMSAVLACFHFADRDIPDILMELGRSLGRFDLEGQLKGLDHVKTMCDLLLDNIRNNKTERMRCYQTLGLCAGAALVIVLV